MIGIIFGFVSGACIAGLIACWWSLKMLDDMFDSFTEYADEAERVIAILEKRMEAKGGGK